jgi:hypothetical protein
MYKSIMVMHLENINQIHSRLVNLSLSYSRNLLSNGYNIFKFAIEINRPEYLYRLQ